MFVPYVFTKKDIVNNFENESQCNNWVNKQLRTNKIVKIRNGLFTQVDASGIPLANKFEVATKIADDAFVCYHSALEYYGIANQVFNTVTVGSDTRFRNFIFNDVEYLRKPAKHTAQVIFVVTSATRVASLERTVIDCINDVDAAGGIDELLNALEQIRVIDENKLLQTLNMYDSILLYQKAGYILEQYKETFGLTDSFFAECRKHLTNQVKYFLQDEYSDVEYNCAWKLMAPKNIKSRIDGGI